MSNLTIKDHVRGKVRFSHYNDGQKDININNFSRYRKGNLYFINEEQKETPIKVPADQGYLIYITDTNLEIMVPLNDTGDADFHAEDKAMLFMRYIRKALK